MAENKETICVIGAGTIGLSWSALFAHHGHRVRLNDVTDGFEERVSKPLREMIEDFGGDTDASFARVSFHGDLAQALDGATMVQENVPENPEFKQKLFAEIESKVGADTLLASSSSGIIPDVIGKSMKAPERVMIGHPLNPPHMMRLVEICAASGASEEDVARLTAFYESCERIPVQLNKPIPGFVVNRLQTAMIREAIHIISEGVVDVAGMDKIVINALGVRYASIGPMLTGQLGGGKGGLEEMVDKILSGLIKALNLPPVDEKTLKLLGEQAAKAYPLDRMQDFAEARNIRQNAVVDVQTNHPLPKF